MERWESLQSAARRTGFSYRTFQNWKYKGKLPFPFYVVKRQVRVKPGDIDRWMENGKDGDHRETF